MENALTNNTIHQGAVQRADTDVGEDEVSHPMPKKPRTSEDFYLFCKFILDYENYDLLKNEEVQDKDTAVAPVPPATGAEKPNDVGAVDSEGTRDAQERVTTGSELEVSSDEDSYDLVTCFCQKPFAGRPMIECNGGSNMRIKKIDNNKEINNEDTKLEPAPTRPVTSDDFYEFCSSILDYVKYVPEKNEEVKGGDLTIPSVPPTAHENKRLSDRPSEDVSDLDLDLTLDIEEWCPDKRPEVSTYEEVVETSGYQEPLAEGAVVGSGDGQNTVSEGLEETVDPNGKTALSLAAPESQIDSQEFFIAGSPEISLYEEVVVTSFSDQPVGNPQIECGGSEKIEAVVEDAQVAQVIPEGSPTWADFHEFCHFIAEQEPLEIEERPRRDPSTLILLNKRPSHISKMADNNQECRTESDCQEPDSRSPFSSSQEITNREKTVDEGEVAQLVTEEEYGATWTYFHLFCLIADQEPLKIVEVQDERPVLIQPAPATVKMRTRRGKVLNERQAPPFETTKRLTRRSKRLKLSKDEDDFVSISCFRGRPYAWRPMIECSRCVTWIHIWCAGIRKSKIPDIFPWCITKRRER